jgi:DNA-binding IclR family transcriptional regulator
MALLAPLADEEIERIVAANGTRLKDYGRLNVPIVVNMIGRAKQLGFALNDRQETPGVISIGVPVANRYGPPYAAISVGAISSRMSAERQKEIAAIVKHEVRSLEKRLAEAASA